MKTLIKVCCVDMVILGLACAGILFDERFLDLYQFVMWSIVIIAAIALILPAKDLFKNQTNSTFKNIVNWFFTILKILTSVWLGMVFLAVFYLIISMLCYGKKQAHFDGLKTSA